MQRTHDFISELLKGNSQNNYLKEVEKGRGIIHEKPVSLEPCFEQFNATHPYGHIRNTNTGTPSRKKLKWHFCRLRIPKNQNIDWQTSTTTINTLSQTKGITSFEVIFEEGEARFFVGSTSKRELENLAFILNKVFGAVTYPCSDPLQEREWEHFITIGARNYHNKIHFERSIYEHINQDCLIQTVFTPTRGGWAKNIKELAKTEKFFGMNSSTLKDTEQPLYAGSIRIACKEEQIASIRALCGIFTQCGKALPHREAKEYQVVCKKAKEVIPERTIYAPGILLTSEELAGFIHLPAQIKTDFVTGFPVSERLKSGGVLGINTYSEPALVCIPEAEQYKSRWMLGRSRSGKSVCIQNQLSNLIEQGEGGALIDPHRKTAKEFLGMIPKEHHDRVLYIDFDDETDCVQYNIFDEEDPKQYGTQTLEVVNALECLFDSESFHRLNHILRNTIYALFVLKKNLTTIPTLLSDSDEGTVLRKQVISQAPNLSVRNFWRNEFPHYPKDAFSPILSRFSALFMDDKINNLFSQEKNKVNIKEIMDNSKILIVALPTVTKVADIIGSLLLSQFRKEALQRNKTGYKKDYYLFVDEFHRFKCDQIIESIAHETAKNGLHICVANQQTKQLSESLLQAVSSMQNTVIFGVNTNDARRMIPLFDGKVKIEDFNNLKTGECIARISGEIINFKGLPPQESDPAIAEQIIKQSKAQIYTPIQTKRIKPIKRELDYF